MTAGLTASGYSEFKWCSKGLNAS